MISDTNKDHIYKLLAFGAALTTFTIARQNLHSYPLPWNDEARFFLPAIWWAEHGTFRPLNLNAPAGIFWVPDGFTVIMGTLLRLFGTRIEVAHVLCEAFASFAVYIFASSARILANSRTIGLTATMCLITPPYLFCANMARMEALLVLVIALALFLHCHGKHLSAGSLLIAGVLVHPIIVPTALGYWLVTLPTQSLRKFDRRFLWSWVLAIFVIGCALIEARHFFVHSEVVHQHMAYQAARKASRPLKSVLFKAQAAVAFASAVLLATILTKGRLWKTWSQSGLLAVAVAVFLLMFSAVLGAEITYNVYSFALGPATVVCLVFRALTDAGSAKEIGSAIPEG